MIANILLTLFFAALTAATLEVRTGLLDRFVQHYKENFLHDLANVAPVKIKVSIERAPPGYVDSPDWDYDSVMRLISLIRESETEIPQPVRRVLRDILAPKPSRRYMGMGSLHQARVKRQKRKALARKCLTMNPKDPGYPNNCPHNLERIRNHQLKKRTRMYKKPEESSSIEARKSGNVRRQNLIGARKQNKFLQIPSLVEDPDDIYYDDRWSVEVTSKGGNRTRTRYDPKRDNDIFVIENPVEAKLPSKYLTVGQIRRILEERAEAARWMPPRETTTISYATLVRSESNDSGKVEAGDTTVGEADTGDGAATKAEGEEEAKPDGEEEAKPDGEEEAQPDGEEEAPAEE